MTAEDDFEDDDQFPWEDVEAGRISGCSASIPSPKASSITPPPPSPCPQCHNTASQLSWFYFESPVETWEHLCGRAGWMTACDRCHLQVDFFCEVLN